MLLRIHFIVKLARLYALTSLNFKLKNCQLTSNSEICCNLSFLKTVNFQIFEKKQKKMMRNCWFKFLKLVKIQIFENSWNFNFWKPLRFKFLNALKIQILENRSNPNFKKIFTFRIRLILTANLQQIYRIIS